MKITEKIKTYEDVCKAEGIDPVKSLPYPSPQNAEEIAVNSFFKVTKIAKVLNEDWKPNWNDNDERKYYPWFDMETYGDLSSSGVGFSSNDYDFDRSGSIVGSRLVFKSRELAVYAGTQFLAEYRGFMVIE